MLLKKDWEEINKILAKHKIGYTVSYQDHKTGDITKVISIKPIEVVYFEEEYKHGSVSLIDGHIDFTESEENI